MRSAALIVATAIAGVLMAVLPVNAAERQPQKWAMLVGVNDYANLQDLRYASKDMQALAASLTSAGFSESHVFVFHDEVKDAKFKPLKANIERQLGLMMRLAEKGDVLLVAFSGHGMHLEGKSYLCPTEAQDDNPNATMIAVDDVYTQLEKCPATFRMMIVDACRNDPRPAGRRSATPKENLTSLGRAFQQPPDGIVVLASCAPGQISYEEDEFQHGVFMNYVLKGLAGEADGNKDGKVSLGELYEFSWLETKTYVARARSDYQAPQQFGRIEGTYWFERATVPTIAVRPETRTEARPVTSLPAASTNAPPGNPKKSVTNSIKMELVLIPAGEFVMGSPDTEEGRGNDELQHRVRISQPFYLGKYEVTQAEYTAVLGKNPSFFSSSGEDKARVAGQDTGQFPVEGVSWEDAVDFCRRLSTMEDKTYRLPTETEWEYACRADTTSAYAFGNACNGREANCAGNDPYGTTTKGPYLQRTNRVGSYDPNAFGLYDMHGNVWEWCSDCYDADYYARSPTSDPTGPPSGTRRAIRGGGWLFDPSRCRSARRRWGHPEDRHNYYGFRVVLSADQSP